MPTSPAPSTGPASPASALDIRILVMVLAAAACLLPWITPPIALAIGIVLALLSLTTQTKLATKVAKYLIQIAIVMMGLGMDLRQVAQAGLVGLAFAAGTIVGTFALGIALGKLLKIDAKLTTLLSSGTAICGGSAIAAVSSVIAATEAQIAVAMGAVFLLNAIAIYIFPAIGLELHMTQQQFGTWAAVAIHDVANVVGAAGIYDRFDQFKATPDVATQTATAVKLTRTLWIAPVALCCAWWFRSSMGLPAHVSGASPEGLSNVQQPTPSTAAVETRAGKPVPRKPNIPIPWFILWFVLAAALGTLFHDRIALYADFASRHAKKEVMSVALLLIGCGLSPKAVMSVGWRAMVMAVALWIAISVAALVVVLKVGS